jgi:hypothetical protein
MVFLQLDGPGGRTGSSVRRMVARKARQSRRPEPMQGSGSQHESAHGVGGSSTQNRRVTWLSHKTKSRGSTGGYGIRACRELKLRCQWTRGGIARLASGGRRGGKMVKYHSSSSVGPRLLPQSASSRRKPCDPATCQLASKLLGTTTKNVLIHDVLNWS